MRKGRELQNDKRCNLQEESGRSRKVTKEAWLQHPTMVTYQIKKRSTHTHTVQKKKKNDGQIKKTAKRVTDCTLPCYGAMVGKRTVCCLLRLIEVVTALIELIS